MYNFSKAGIKNKELYCRIYADFISWCKSIVPSGTFSTYSDGEPACFYLGVELSYSNFLNNKKINSKKSNKIRGKI